MNTIDDLIMASQTFHRIRERVLPTEHYPWGRHSMMVDEYLRRWIWVSTSQFPRAPCMAALERFLNEHPYVKWTHMGLNQIGFADHTHAVMFRLMLP